MFSLPHIIATVFLCPFTPSQVKKKKKWQQNSFLKELLATYKIYRAAASNKIDIFLSWLETNEQKNRMG